MVALYWTFECWKWKKKVADHGRQQIQRGLGHDERDLPLVADEDTHKWIRRWPMTFTCSTLQHFWGREWRAQRAQVPEPFQVIGPVFISIYSPSVLLPIPTYKFPFLPPKKGYINSKVPHFSKLPGPVCHHSSLKKHNKSSESVCRNMEAITDCVRKARCIQFDICSVFALFFKKKKTRSSSLVIDRLLVKMMQHISTEIHELLTGEPVLSLKHTLFRLRECWLLKVSKYVSKWNLFEECI